MGKSKCCSKCFLGSLIYVLVLVLLLFLVIFVIIPVIFKYSVEIQRNIIFPTWLAGETNYTDIIEEYGLKGVRNMYVTVDDKDNITLGIWQILPQDVVLESLPNDQYDYDRVLSNEKYNILLYLHGNGGVRSLPIELYDILRKYFQIIACDYRGYADSSKAELTEDGIVNDTINLYKWIKNKTKARVFFWGHSLGTGISTHAISDLKAQNFTPSGLVLETPFSSVTDVMERHPIIKLYSWLPWFRSLLLDPIVDNGFGFESIKYVVNVDCPIMILHAVDDTVIPYDLATKLYDTAVLQRNTTFQGNITYHLFPERGYDHMLIYLAPELPTYIENFIQECLNFAKFTGT